MNEARSFYLDVLRFTAANVVFLFHLLAPPYLPAQVPVPARQAVTIFFVISGFVIAYVADTKENTWRTYAASRMSRLYSVVLPALLLTGILYVVGSRLAPDAYAEYSHPIARLAVSLLFLNQSWNLTVQALNNGPFWSLCYEFWYYVAFGALLFARWPWNLGGVVVAATIAGPRIVLLFPTWALGVATYALCKRRVAPTSATARVTFVAALGWVVWMCWNGTPAAWLSAAFEGALVDGYVPIGEGAKWVYIGGDWRFPDDFFLGLVVALTIYLAPAWHGAFPIPKPVDRAVRFAASFTFSVYLYHAPLLVAYHAMVIHMLGRAPAWPVLFVLVLTTTIALGMVTEHARPPYHRFFLRLLGAGRRDR